MASVSPSITALFPASKAKEVLKATLAETLTALKSQQYTWEVVKESTKPLANLCRERLKGESLSTALAWLLHSRLGLLRTRARAVRKRPPPLSSRSPLAPLHPPRLSNAQCLLPAALNAARYKLFVQVHLAEAKGQGIRVVSRMLWDQSSDVMVTETFSCDLPGKEGESISIIASASVHAVYMP